MFENVRVSVRDAPDYEDFEGELKLSMDGYEDNVLCLIQDDEKNIFVIDSKYIKEI